MHARNDMLGASEVDEANNDRADVLTPGAAELVRANITMAGLCR